jgi:DNA-binding transcriptional LysR family regulator
VELRDEQFISYREGATIRRLLVSAATEAGFQPRFAFESNEAPRVRALVERGLGIAVMPRSHAEAAGDGIAVATLSGPTVRRDVTLAWHSSRSHSPAAAAFLDLARQAEQLGALALC